MASSLLAKVKSGWEKGGGDGSDLVTHKTKLLRDWIGWVPESFKQRQRSQTCCYLMFQSLVRCSSGKSNKVQANQFLLTCQ